MSFDKVEVRVFSGPDQVQVGSNTEPDLIVMNIGPKGDAGTAATVTVGTTTTLAPGSSATVANAGTSSAAVFNFGIPTGATGATGAAGANGGSSTAWRYRAKTNATSGYPTNGHLLWNNAMQVNATEILVSHLDDEGSDIELFLSFFAEGQKLFIQNRDDSSQNQIWEITGTPTVTNPNTSTAYYTFPVTLVSSQGAAFTNNHSILFGTITEVTNSVTSATTSNGTANLSVLTLGVVPSGSITLASTNSGGFVQLNGQAATDARSIAFPNASGTLALTSQLPTLGTNVATFLATPTSANLASALTDENGTGGGFVRAEGASLTTPTLVGTPVFNATAYTYGAGAAAAHRAALNIAPLVDPEMIRGLQLKLAADDLQYQGLVAIANNDTVAAWRAPNKPLTITGEIVFSQATVGSRPIYQTNIQNSLPGVFFDGVNDVMTSNAALMSLLGNNARTVFIVCRPTALASGGAGTTWNRPQIYGNLGQFNGLSVSPSGPNNILTAWDYDTTGVIKSVATAAVAPNTTVLLTQRHEKGVTSISLNQGTPVTASVLRDCTNATTLQLGSTVAGSGFYQGYIFEILMYARVLTSTEIAVVETYLKTKWNV
jgi:hypothetical protein